MIDYFALALTHGLLLVALLRLVRRKDLDRERDGDDSPAVAEPRGRHRTKGRRRA